jgi:diacylglycerol kinase family enzyme
MSVAILVNLKARHGSAQVGEHIRRILPDARVAVTSSLDEARAWVKDELVPHRPSLLLSGGGDGTAVALLNELRDQGMPLPTFGLLGLGTGNGWARATGDVGKRAVLRGLERLSNAGSELPVRTFDLVETEGRVTPFAGTGWDAQILADYKDTVTKTPRALDRLGGSTGGYLRSLFTKTIPRQLFGERPRVRVVNLGEDALTVDASGKAVPLPGGERGRVLYEGPLSVGGAASTEELGLGFRAFRFAHLVPGRMAVRVYAATTAGATLRMPLLWRGVHPLADDHHFFVTKCRFEFDRAVPFEIGGDLVGERREVELSRHPVPISLVDFRRVH